MASTTSDPTNEILLDYNSIFRVYKDGRIVRSAGTEEFAPPGTDPVTNVTTTDVTTDPVKNITARLHVPNVDSSSSVEKKKLPILVYFHGGAFCWTSAFLPQFQPYLNSVASRAQVLVVSVNYRLATEHLLPAAYEDSLDAIKWLRSSSGSNELLAKYGDIDRVFLGGESAGTNPSLMTKEALKTEEFSWLDLPTEMVELIISKLPLSDHPNLASVCKTWSSIMHTILPIYPVGKSPLLLHFKTIDSGIFHYYSPYLNKTFQVDFPFDFKGYEILSAKDGFLLIYNRIEMTMINPFNGHTFPLPGLTDSLSFNGIAIGVHGGYYVIFLIDSSYNNEVVILVYDSHPSVGWEVDLSYDNSKPFCMSPSSNPVYCDGRFYCLGMKWNLGIFDLLEGTWSIVDVEFKKYDRNFMKDTYLVEWSDTVIAVQIEIYGTGIHVFSLDREKMVWEEIFDLGDRSLFVGSRMSVVSVPMEKKLRNKVFVPRFHGELKPIVAKVLPSNGLFYFISKFLISSKENDNTSICSYNLANGEKSEYLGSTEKLCSIWLQPFYHGIV